MEPHNIDYSMIDLVNEHGSDIKCWDFLESFVVHIVSDKCKSFHNNRNNEDLIYGHRQNKMQMQTKRGIGDGHNHQNELLLGYAQENEQIKFIDYYDEDSDDTDLDIQENQNMDDIFDLEIEETLSSALDLLPDFCSIPIDDDNDISQNNANITNMNIDACLKMLKHIDANCNSRILEDQRENKLIHKISEMRDIIESLQYKLSIPSREGFVYNDTKTRNIDSYTDSDDEDETEGESVYKSNGNITLMGEGQPAL